MTSSGSSLGGELQNRALHRVSLLSAPVETLEHEVTDTADCQDYQRTDGHVDSFLDPVPTHGVSLAGQDQMLVKQVGEVVKLMYYLALTP